MKLWIFICCTCLAEELKTDENTCFVGEGNELKETKVPAPICRFEIEYESEQCTSKFATHYKTVQHWRTDLAMEIEGSHCTYTDTKIDCVCVGSGCNEPFSVKKILAKEIPKTRSRSKIRKLLCFMTDGDLFGNGTVIGTPAPTTTTEESELTSTQVGRTRTPFRDKDKVTEAPPKKATKPSPPKDPKGAKSNKPVGEVQKIEESDEDFVRNLSLHVVFGLLLLMLIFANIVFFTLVLYYKKKEEDERDKLPPMPPKEVKERKSKKKELDFAEKSAPGSAEKTAPTSADKTTQGSGERTMPGSAEKMMPGFAEGRPGRPGMTRHPMYG